MFRVQAMSSAVPVRHEFLVNSDPSDAPGYYTATAVAGTSNGSFLIAWSGLLNGSDQGIDSNGSDILARSFSSSGPLGADIIVNSELRDGQVSPAAASIGDHYVVAYSSGDENSLPGTYAASQILALSGSRVGPEVFGDYSYYNTNSDVTFLDSTRYTVTSSQEEDYEARVRTSDGVTLADFRFGSESYFRYQSSTVATTGMTYQLVWTGYADPNAASSDDAQRGIYARAGSTGGAIGTGHLLQSAATGTGMLLNVDSATLGNGDVVVAYQHGVVVESLIFDPVSYALIGEAAVAHGGSGSQLNPAVASLDDGGYVVTWSESGANGSDIFAQLFDAGGQARDGAFMVNEITGGDQRLPSVASIGNDDFVIAWDGPDGIKAATFSADTTSTGGMNGDAGDNMLQGGGGNDMINGAGGNDRISGGAGNDYLLGGAGDDTLRGDAGDDDIAGGAGNDLILGGTGIDRLTGGAGADIFAFRALSEIGNGGTLGASDVITDLQQGIDKIDLSRLHLDAGALAFSRYLAYTVVSIDANHDGVTDARLLVKHDVALGDFIL